MYRKIEKLIKRDKVNISKLIIFFIIIIFSFYRISELGAPIILMDEFGYWGIGAYFTGRDWSGISQFNNYYSYGYGFILAILIQIFENTDLVYKAAIIINGIFLAATFLLLNRVLKFLFPTHEKIVIILISFTAVCYPSFSSNVHIAWDEILLVLLSVAAIMGLLYLLEKPTIIRSVLFAFILMYSYMVHQRCLGILVSGCLITLFIFFYKKIKLSHMLFFMMSLLLLFMLHSFIKNILLQELFQSEANKNAAVNDYGNIKEHLLYWANSDGIIKLAKSIIGKLLYLIISTFGIFLFGMQKIISEVWIGIKSVIKKTKLKEEMFNQLVIYVFVLLLFLSTLMIAAIYTLDAQRIDVLVYGRYTEWCIAAIIAIGVIQIISEEKRLKYTMVNVIIIIVFSIAIGKIYVNNPDWTLFFWVCSPILSYYYQLVNDKNTYIFIAAAVSISISYVLAIIFNQSGKSKIYKYLGIITVLIAFLCMSRYTVSRSFGSNYRLSITEEFSELITKIDDSAPIYYIQDEGQTIWYAADIQILQINKEIKPINLENICKKDKGYFVLTATREDHTKKLTETYQVAGKGDLITLLYVGAQ